MDLLNSYDSNFLQWFLGEVADHARPNNAAKQVAIMRLVCRKWRDALSALARHLYNTTSPLRTKHLSRCNVGKILKGIRNRSTPRGRFPIIENPAKCEERIPCETLTRERESVTFTERYFLADYYISPYKQKHKIWYLSDDADALFFIETTGHGGLIWKAKYWKIKRSQGESLARLFREGNALKLIEKTASCKKRLYIERHYIREYLHTIKWSKDAIFHEIDDCDGEDDSHRFFRIDETGVHQV